MGVSFLVLVTISNYTAQVTANNVLSGSQGTISSLHEGLARGYRFCGWHALRESIEAQYIELQGRYVGLENGHDVFRSMDEGLCEAAIIDYDSWQLAEGGALSLPGDHTRYAAHPAGAERYHCDTKVLLPALVYSIEIALPARNDLQRLISWLITSTKVRPQNDATPIASGPLSSLPCMVP
jgi:hypothetical protein